MSDRKPHNARSSALAAACAAVLSMAFAAGASAAERVDLQQLDIAAISANYNAAVARDGAPAKAHARHAALIGLGAESHLLLQRRHSGDGVRNSRYQQTFRGIPVYGEHVVVSEDDSGRVHALFGRMIQGLEGELPATAPRLQAPQALEIAKRAVRGASLASKIVKNEKSEQMIHVDEQGRARLVYVVDFFADSPQGGEPTRPLVIVDAESGEIVEQRENLQHAEIGTGPGGNQKTGQHEYGVDFGHLDVTRSGNTCTMNNANVRTVNLNHGTSGSTAYSYPCPRNTVKQINGAYSPLNDAHYFGGVVYDMYEDYMNAAPLTSQLRIRVHYGRNYQNAFWDGSTMTFGDGGSALHPLVSLDVVSHEAAHGFTQQNSNLIYSGQSGGINESFSDMSGEAAKYFMTGTADFMVGASIFKRQGALRYMSDPTRDGRSIDHADDYYNDIGVHFSSGVYNKAFYLLATAPGWNVKTAFQAFARANRDYWTPSTNFDQGACGVQRAAADMGMNVQQVIDAFDAVGVIAVGNNCGNNRLRSGVPATGPGAQA